MFNIRFFLLADNKSIYYQQAIANSKKFKKVKKMKLNVLLFILFAVSSLSIKSQTPNIIIPLKISTGYLTQTTVWMEELAFDKKQLVTKSSNGRLIKIERSPNNADTFIVTQDKNNDGDFSNEESFIVSVNSSQFFTHEKVAKNSKASFREYEFIAERDQEEKVDSFRIRVNYSAKGVFKVAGCSISIFLRDLNADGYFTHEENGSNLGIDRNGDGKISGKDEWGVTSDIIELCGKNYLISNLPKDGNTLTLRRTNLQNVKMYGQSPEFNFTLINGKSLSSKELKGKPYLIDFWATWCGPCIEKMPEIKQLEGILPITYFNTDVIGRKNQALALIDKLQIAENSVLRISPNADNFYKSYQRMQLGLPYYVLIDGEGKIRYGGSGGDNLKDLKKIIAEINKEK